MLFLKTGFQETTIKDLLSFKFNNIITTTAKPKHFTLVIQNIINQVDI